MQSGFSSGFLPNTLAGIFLPGKMVSSRNTGGLNSTLNAISISATGTVTASNTTLTTALTDSADPVITGGDAFSYTDTVTNTGSNTANNVTLTITLDSSLTYVSASGTGWAISQNAGVVTCTRATLAVGAAPEVTVNVTTGGSQITATTTSSVVADNAASANGNQSTTINLVTKDATSGIYIPTSATQWTNFIARKGLSIANPASLWLCGESSGNLADSIGSLTLTAAGSPTYQQAATGWARLGVKTTDGNTDRFSAAAGVGPTPATTSQTWLAIIALPATPANTREVWGLDLGSSGSGFYARHLFSSGKLDNRCVGVSVAGSSVVSSRTNAIALTYDRTGSRADICTDLDKIIGTYSSLVLDGNKGLGGLAAGSATSTMVWACMWSGSNGEISNANIKALFQAMGYTISW